jgi:DNA polymerase I-like protein with 3'-5' exonuclease and polymerase domains
MEAASRIPPPPPELFYGPLGRIALSEGEVTEFDPVGTYGSLICCAGNALSMAAEFWLEDTHFFPLIEYVALVGDTSDARKSSTLRHAVHVVTHLDATWENRVRPDAATGEWIVEQIQDPLTKDVFDKKDNKWVEQPSHPGIEDKRLLIRYDEMLSMITKGRREGCSLIPTIRHGWDCTPMRPGSKSTNAKVDNPRLSVLTATTPEDLRAHFPREWLDDGTTNRFLWLRIRVMPDKPFGGPSALKQCPKEIEQLQKVFERFSRTVTPIRLQMTEACKQRWAEIYGSLRKRGPHKVTHRTEAHVLRITSILALLDNQTQLDRRHLDAAICLYRYSSDCARAIFHPQLVSDEAMQIVEFLRNRGAAGATRHEIRRTVFGGHINAKDLIGHLKETLDAGFTRTAGKQPEYWYAHEVVDWNPTEEPPEPDGSAPDPGAVSGGAMGTACSAGTIQSNAETSEESADSGSESANSGSESATENTPFSRETAQESAESATFYTHIKNERSCSTTHYDSAAQCDEPAASKKESEESAPCHARNPRSVCERECYTRARDQCEGGFLKGMGKSALSALSEEPSSGVVQNACAFQGENCVVQTDAAASLHIIRFATRIALDTETVCEHDISDPRYILEARIRLLSMKVDGQPAVVLDMFEVDDPAPIREALAGKDLVIYNAFFDLPILTRNLGGPVAYRSLFDPMIAAVLIDNVARPREDDSGDEAVVLPPLIDVLYKWTAVKLDKTLQDSDWASTVLSPEQIRYAAMDVEHLLVLADRLAAELERTGLKRVAELEFALVPVTVSTLEQGVYVDTDALARIKAEAEPKYHDLYRCAQRVLGIANPLSPLQVLTVLQRLGYRQRPTKGAFGKCKDVPIKDTKKRTLKQFAGRQEADLVLELRSVKKILEQCETWKKAVGAYGPNVYVRFKQLGTVTGRYSASNPPFQQLKKGPPRELIAAPPGYTLVDFDFEVIEVVCAGVIYKEPRLLEIVRSGDDIYCVVAAMVLGVDRGGIDADDPRRKFGKILVLSLNYCKWVETFIEDCRLEGVKYSDDELRAMYEKYFQLFPGVRRYQQEQDRRAQVGEEARSIWGRRTIMGPGHERWQLRNKLTNHPVQMTCSDLLKAVMVELFRALAQIQGARILASVHDEVLCLVPDALVETVCRLAQQICARIGAEMLGADVPVRINITTGKNWWECTKAEPVVLEDLED